MTVQTQERRKDPRVSFPGKRRPLAWIYLETPRQEKIRCRLTGIGPGGVSISYSRNRRISLQTGDRVTLKSDQLPKPLFKLNETTIEIRHLQDIPIYVNAALGAQFTEISNQQRQDIRHWIARAHGESRDIRH